MRTKELFVVVASCDGERIYYHNFGWEYDAEKATIFLNRGRAQRIRDYMERQAERLGDVYGVKVVALPAQAVAEAVSA